MSGLYVIRNGAEYFLPPLDDALVEDVVQDEEDVVLEGLNALGDRISEFLNCFQLFGYDAKGRPVKLTRMSSYMEHSAIHGLITDELEDEEFQKWVMIDVDMDEDAD